ncbi:MAG: hypothetical protein WCJ13_09515 [Coriobacteriia bacterium]
MLAVKEVLIPAETKLGRTFVTSGIPVAAYVTDRTVKPAVRTTVIEKWVFSDVKAIDECLRVDISVKDPGIKPEEFPAGSSVVFQDLNLGIWGDDAGNQHVFVNATGIRLAKPASDKSAQ